MGEEKEFI